MIPANIDYQAIFTDLNERGYRDSEIEKQCGFAESTVHHLKNCDAQDMTYVRAARLYNFWLRVRGRRA